METALFPALLLSSIGLILSLSKSDRQAVPNLDYYFYLGAIILLLVEFSLRPAPLPELFYASIFLMLPLPYLWWRKIRLENRVKNNKELLNLIEHLELTIVLLKIITLATLFYQYTL